MTDTSSIRRLSLVAESGLPLLSVPINTFFVFVQSRPFRKERRRDMTLPEGPVWRPKTAR